MKPDKQTPRIPSFIGIETAPVTIAELTPAQQQQALHILVATREALMSLAARVEQIPGADGLSFAVTAHAMTINAQLAMFAGRLDAATAGLAQVDQLMLLARMTDARAEDGRRVSERN